MTRKHEKKYARKVLAASISVIGLTTTFAARAGDADDEVRRLLRPESEVEIGVANTSKDSYKFGDFTGMGESGTYLIGNLRMVQRGEKDAGYLEIVGRNLGLDSRNLRVEGGVQGNYRMHAEYDQLPKLFSDSYQTPFINPGARIMTLPAGWVEANATGGMAQLNGSMRSFDVKTTRKSLSFGASKKLSPEWDMSVDIKRENKDGNRFIGAVIGNSGGNPRAVILPEPVDYTTDQFEAVARYTTTTLQFQVGYYASIFKNGNTSLAWQNPYANIAGTAWGNAAVGYSGGGYGQIGLPPDNQFHQLNASGAYRYSEATRLSGSLSFGRMTQDEPFLAYTINPALTVGVPLPRASLDGKVETMHADLKLTSLLMPKLRMNAAYRYDDRDNKTPQAEYWYIGGDSQTQTAAGTGKIRTNLPGSSTKQQISAELDYHLASHTKAKLGYEYDWVKKTFEAIDKEREHTVKAGVEQRFGETVSGGVSYAYSDRKTSDYNAGAPFLASYSSTYWNPMPADQRWDNVPTQKKFFLAPRKRDKLRAYANFSPAEQLDLQFGVDYKNDDYHQSEFGLQKAEGWMANIDASLAASEAVTAHLFATLEDYKTTQRSAMLGAVKLNYLNPGYAWLAPINDRTLTFGAGLRVKPGGKYEFGGDFSHSNSTGKISVETGSLIAAASQAKPMPEQIARLNRVDVFARYWLQKDLSINLKYVYERYWSTDWGYDQVAPGTLASVIGTNQVSPDYKVHLIGASVSYRFF